MSKLSIADIVISKYLATIGFFIVAIQTNNRFFSIISLIISLVALASSILATKGLVWSLIEEWNYNRRLDKTLTDEFKEGKLNKISNEFLAHYDHEIKETMEYIHSSNQEVPEELVIISKGEQAKDRLLDDINRAEKSDNSILTEGYIYIRTQLDLRMNELLAGKLKAKTNNGEVKVADEDTIS